MNQKLIHDAIVAACKLVAPKTYLLELELKEKISFLPGQFIMLQVSPGPFLRRPFSILDIIDGRLQILFKICGSATALMAAVKTSESMNFIGPLGSPFPSQAVAQGRVLLVGGGIGMVPLYPYAKYYQGEKVYFIGGRKKEDLLYADEFKKLGIPVYCATDDGSHGFAGSVVSLVQKHMRPRDVIFGCGPRRMLEALAHVCEEKGVTGYLSLEGAMACGFGTCLSCAVPVKKEGPGWQFKRVCTEGPVFSAGEILWQIFK